MAPETEAIFTRTAMRLGLSRYWAGLLARAANGESMKQIALHTGLARPSAALCRIYDILDANHRAHAVAIVFEAMLHVDLINK